MLVRGSNTTHTQPVNETRRGFSYTPVAPDPLQRRKPVFAPPLVASRRYGKGKIVAMAQWRQYTIGSGDRWLFASQIMSTGAKHRRSDMRELLSNIVEWLTVPVADGPSGYVQRPILYPNEAKRSRDAYISPAYKYNRTSLQHASVAQNVVTRGLIGVRSAYSGSSSTGTIAEYAEAAKAVGLGFLVFTEEWSTQSGQRTLSNLTLQKLKADCKLHSTPDLELIPGFAIENNIGNKMIILGYGVEPPPAAALTDDKSQLLLQGIDPLAPHNYTGYNAAGFAWLHASVMLPVDEERTVGRTVAYYNLGSARKAGAMAMGDLRDYSMAAVFYHASDGSMEDLRSDFLEAAESTIAPTPVAVSDIHSPASLGAAAQNHWLTHVTGSGPSSVFHDGLRWNNQYDAMQTYVSNGPIINTWAQTNRVYTLGAERFVTASALMVAPLSVSSANAGADLKKVEITNGRQLFRRFMPNRSDFNRTLLLDGYVQKDLVLSVEDDSGCGAFGAVARTWKPGGQHSVVFCDDHINDCRTSGMQLVHGPGPLLATYVPVLSADVAGFTWSALAIRICLFSFQ
eukprot:SAG31_NODE_1665_length_7585_cov_6.666711_6_plen_569_part_00